jgi:hypothetical protein
VNPYCSGLAPRKEAEGDETGESPQAVGVVIELGKFPFGDFSDITRNKELALLGPDNKAQAGSVFDDAPRGRIAEGDLGARAPRRHHGQQGA